MTNNRIISFSLLVSNVLSRTPTLKFGKMETEKKSFLCDIQEDYSLLNELKAVSTLTRHIKEIVDFHLRASLISLNEFAGCEFGLTSLVSSLSCAFVGGVNFSLCVDGNVAKSNKTYIFLE